jgi:hypothetical protein
MNNEFFSLTENTLTFNNGIMWLEPYEMNIKYGRTLH